MNFNILSAQTTSVEHLVVKGDNIYRLSLRYGVPMESIFQLNPGSRTMIKTGELILIPNKARVADVNIDDNDTQFKNYVVSKGETKYGLSKKFNISIKALEDANPSIVKMLLANQTIRVPSISSEDIASANTSTEVASHIVKKGETLWRISQQYNLTLTELKDLNKDKLGEFLIIGQELTIQKNVNNSNNNDSYVVVKGDTKFSLAKRFNLTISELEQLNPQIVPMLKYNTRINTRLATKKESKVNNIVKNQTEAEVAEISTNETVMAAADSSKDNPDSKFEEYTIKSKETLYGLAKKANMSIEEFLVLNPSLKTSVTKGSIIKMPFQNISPQSEVSTNAKSNNENLASNTNESAIVISVYWDENKDLGSSEIEKLKGDYHTGLQKVMDSIRKKYPNTNLQIKNGLTNLTNFNDTSSQDTPHIQLSPIEFFKEPNTSFSEIDVMSLRYDYQGNNKEFTFKVLATEDDMRRKVLTHLNEQNANVICIYDKSHTQNKNLIKNSLTKVTFIPTKKNGTFDSDELNNTLNSDIKNYVIIESDKVGVFLSSTNILLKRMSNTNIQLVVLNPKNIPSDGAIASKRFKILQLLYPQQYNPELSNGLSKTTALGYAFSYDILNRLLNNSLESFDSKAIISVFGFTFDYKLEDGIYKNKSVKLCVFDESLSGIQINKD